MKEPKDMQAYAYKIILLDALFYAREGLSAAFTPPYLHATAVNLAVKASICLDPQDQPLLISEGNGGRNTPRYQNSLVSPKFYFTPARLASPLCYRPEITKGENDGFTVENKQGEVLKAEILNYLPPETEFKGYLMSKQNLNWPQIIRLGTFRGKARLEIRELENISAFNEVITVSHPVDPLVSKVHRGIMVNMFPYPIIENALSSHVIRNFKKPVADVIALPDLWNWPEVEKIISRGSAII